MAIPPERLSDLPQSELPQWVQEINVVRSFNSPQFMSFINEFKGLPVTLEGKGQELPQALRDKGVLASYRDGNTELFNDTKIIKNLDNSGSIELLSAHEEGQDSAIKRKFEFSTENNELSRLIYTEEIRNLDNTKSEVKTVVSLKDGKQIVEEVSIKSPDGSVEYSLKGSERSDKLSIDGSEWSRSKPSEAVRVTPGGTLAKDLSERLGAAPAEVYVPLDQDKWNAQLSDAAKRVDSRVVNDRDRAIRPGIDIAKAQAAKKAEEARLKSEQIFQDAEKARKLQESMKRQTELENLPKDRFIELNNFATTVVGKYGTAQTEISSYYVPRKIGDENYEIRGNIFHHTVRNQLTEPKVNFVVKLDGDKVVFTGDTEIRKFPDKAGSIAVQTDSEFEVLIDKDGKVTSNGLDIGPELFLAFADKKGDIFDYDKVNNQIRLKTQDPDVNVKDYIVRSINEQLAEAREQEQNKDEDNGEAFESLVSNLDAMDWQFWRGDFEKVYMKNTLVKIMGESQSERAVNKFIEIIKDGVREELNNPIKTDKSVSIESLSLTDKLQSDKYSELITKVVLHGMQQESKVPTSMGYELNISDDQSSVIDEVLTAENLDLAQLFPDASRDLLMLKLGNALNAGRIAFHQLRVHQLNLGSQMRPVVYKGNKSNQFFTLMEPPKYGDDANAEFPEMFLARRIRESFIQNQDFFRAA